MSKVPMTVTEALLRTRVGDDEPLPTAIVDMTAQLASELMRSLLVASNALAQKEATKEAYYIQPNHVLAAMDAYPDLKAKALALPKPELKKKKKMEKRGKDLFKGQSHDELLAAQNALFAQAKAQQDM